MSKPYIRYTTSESGDWTILHATIDDGYGMTFSGHSVPDHVWIKLLKDIGCEVEHTCISDEQMESMC